MKYLLIGFISLLSIFGATCQITKYTWSFSPWNYYPLTGTPCIPANFSVIQNSNALNIVYTYDLSLISAACPSNTSQYAFSTLTASTTASNTWTDPSGIQVVYNNNSYYGSVVLSIPGSNYTFIYEATADSVEEQIFAYIGGTWTISTSANTTLCPPSSLIFSPSPFPKTPGQIQVITFYPSNCPQTGVTNLQLYSLNSQGYVINWADTPSNPTFQVAFNYSSGSNSITLTLNNTNNFTYNEDYAEGYVQGNWILDWQSNTTGLNFPNNYELEIEQVLSGDYVSSSFMLNNSIQNGFIVTYLSNYEFYDNVLDTIFQYDYTSQALLDTTNPILYSRNGSLFSPQPFVQFWGPSPYSDLPSCCAPKYINIELDASNPDLLKATYIFTESEESACQTLLPNITGGQIETTLYIKNPNFTGLVWTDSLGSQLYFTHPAYHTDMTVNFAGQCYIDMEPTDPPTPPSGSWMYDWRNYYPEDTKPCIPTNFTIIGSGSNTMAIVYTYNSSTTGVNCPQGQTQFSTLTGNTTMNIWTDSLGQQFAYDPDNEVILFTPASSSYTYLYSTNGNAFLTEPVILGVMSRSWSQSGNLTNGTCCFPDSISTAGSPFTSANPELLLTSYFTSTSCSSSSATTKSLFIKTSNGYPIYWVDNVEHPLIQLYISEYPNGLNLTLGPNCNQYYLMSTSNILPYSSSSWSLDWQTSSAASNFPTSYQTTEITFTYPNTAITVNYVTSQFTFNSISESGYLVTTPQSQLYDSALNVTFAYESPALVSTSPPVMYSQNGSALIAAPFVNTWSTPTPYNTTGCCTPSSINITASASDPNALTATYTLPSGYANNSACQDFIDVSDGQIVSALSIKTPSAVQLTWTDKYGSVISFLSPQDIIQISVNFANQCTFTMSSPTPPPGPLSGNWISNSLVFVVMGVFMLLGCL